MASLVDHLGRERPRTPQACMTTVGHDAASFATDELVEMRILAPYVPPSLRRRKANRPRIERIGLVGLDGRAL